MAEGLPRPPSQVCPSWRPQGLKKRLAHSRRSVTFLICHQSHCWAHLALKAVMIKTVSVGEFGLVFEVSR